MVWIVEQYNTKLGGFDEIGRIYKNENLQERLKGMKFDKNLTRVIEERREFGIPKRYTYRVERGVCKKLKLLPSTRSWGYYYNQKEK